MPNLLASEKSPYLLQHAHNPVNWYPWGDAAFAKSRAESKPIFVSIGYSTCHWCHVMAHQSFENEQIARELNEHFVSVKVDREERPDVDRVYMLFVQATTGGGGWPMSVWLTPHLEPFYGGTYFPPTARWGGRGLLEILQEIARLWRDDPGKVRRSAAHVAEQMKKFGVARGAGQSEVTGMGAEVVDRAAEAFRQTFDAVNGGFGGAPKFPRPSDLFFLLRRFALTGDAAARDMTLATLRSMAHGGIHDHLGGGFHRYSVDARWHVPHFEKMLYDQAQLALAYVEAWQVSHDPEFAQVAADILRYTARDLGRTGGGFYSAEDADSIPPEQAGDAAVHPREGAFYVWTEPEIRDVLGGDAEAAILRFGARPDGNLPDDPQGELKRKNVLYLARSIEETAAAIGRSPEAAAVLLEDATRRLFETRRKRPRPARDDKLIVAWNGLAIAAFARASRVLSDRAEAGDWLNAARDAAQFIRAKMWNAAEGRLLRRYRDGEAAIEAYADDFACLVFGLLELFQADGDARWLEWAQTLQRRQNELFADAAAGGWFSTTGRDPSVLLRLKEDYDGAEPAVSSISAWNLLSLARLAPEEDVAARLERTFGAFHHQLVHTPTAMPMMLAALCAWLGPKQEVVIVGAEDSEGTRALKRAIARRYVPFAVTVPLPPEKQEAVARQIPFVRAMSMRDGRATAYVCRDFACSRPTTDPDAMLDQLQTP